MEFLNVRPKSWISNKRFFPDYNGTKTSSHVSVLDSEEWFPLIENEEENVFQYITKNISVNLGRGKIIEVPYQLKGLNDEIEKSKYILDLKEDWDGEGSKGYKGSTWERAVRFVLEYFLWSMNEFGRTIEPPKIYHGPDGSIDILWKYPKYRILINIPEDQDIPATIYGDDYKLEQIEGRFDPNKLNVKIFYTLTNLE